MNKNKRFLWIGFFVLLLLGAGTAWLIKTSSIPEREDAAVSQEKTLYTCGMHPQVIQDHPGNCPICEMKLTPIRKQRSDSSFQTRGERKIKYYKSTMIPGEISQTPGKDSMGMEMVPVYEDEAINASAISIDPVTTQNMNLRTELVERGPLRRIIRTVATIDFNETTLTDITTKFKGWIEKLYVDSTGMQVMRGQPLFSIYSPELYSAQTELLLALETPQSMLGGDALKISALTKLRYFDISSEQIDELKKTRLPQKTLVINAPYDGIVAEKMAVEGQMVDPGMKLYRLADISTVWVYAQIYEEDLPFVKLGQEATMILTYLPDRKFRGRMTYIYPTVDEKTRTVRVRMEFHNPGYYLKPGMFATVEITSELASSVLLVPTMAILRSGEKNTVFVALEGGKFDPRTVTLGPRAEGDQYQVLSGLQEGDRIVTSGQFLLDSESQLREAIQKMTKPTPAAKQSMPNMNMPTMAPSQQSSDQESQKNESTYICPMPEHTSIEYSQPGKCSICGMALVPVSRELLEKIKPGGHVVGYTCPMPEHSNVRENKLGKCPLCGMTLVPMMENNQTSQTSDAKETPILYTCLMPEHVDVVSDKPEKCFKCDMTLVPTNTVEHGKISEEHWRKQHEEKSAPASTEKHQH